MQFLPNIHYHAYLVALPQRRQEIVLNLVDFENSDDLEVLTVLSDAEHKMAAVGVCKSGYRLIGVTRNLALRFLELDIAPFIRLEQVHQFILRHAVTPTRS